MKKYLKSILRPFWIKSATFRRRIAGLDDFSLQILTHEDFPNLKNRIAALENQVAAMKRSIFIPELSRSQGAESSAFMASSTCQAEDFFHPQYTKICKLMGQRPQLHRKQWEWVFILNALIKNNALQDGARGLGFGVGTEPLPAVFASLGVEVMATDAPMEVLNAGDWKASNQHSGDVAQLYFPNIAPNDLVRKMVSHKPCDMNDIGGEFSNYDFNWSSCCFEHLGSIELGLQFVINSVEKTLKPGGIAVHTTEFNSSSNSDTVSEGGTVLFRLRDLEELVERLRSRGHSAETIVIGPTEHILDYHVDVPPYSQDLHLKLLLAGYVTTSIGIIVRRGI